MHNRHKFLTTALVGLLTLGLSVPAMAEITQTKDSADFEWLYEFEGDTAALPDAIDLDENGTGDFSDYGYGSGVNSVSDGALHMALMPSAGYNMYAGLATDGTLWRNIGFDRTAGVTVEIRVKVTSADPYTEGVLGAFSLSFTAADSDIDSALYIGSTHQNWKGAALGEVVDNTDDYHTFRLALETHPDKGSETFAVWRDGVYIGTGLGDTEARTGLNRIILGSGSSACTGSVDIDYVRIGSGSWAPVPEPSSLVLLLSVLGLAVFYRRAR